MTQTGTLGTQAEKLALKFLKRRGLKPTLENYRCRHGEIDLIMQDQNYTVFVEVRHRTSQQYGGALESIDQFKQSRLRRSAKQYLIEFKKSNCPCRFDVLCLNGDISNPEYEWIKNAF